MHRTIDVLAQILTVIMQIFDKLGAWIVLPAIGLVMITDVILRYIFNSPFIWSLEFGQWMLLFIFVAAVPECTRRHGHIRMELLYVVMPRWFRTFVAFLYALIAGGLFWLVMQVELEEFAFSYRLGRITEFLELPVWAHHAGAAIMCVLVIAFFTVRAIGIVAGHDPYPEVERDVTELED